MSKGKQRESTTEDAPVPDAVDPSGPAAGSKAEDPLAAEVEAFLSQRAALSERIVEEIAATETRLAELKKTLAMLVPGNGATSGSKEKKPKKVKTKEVVADHRPTEVAEGA